MVSENFILDFKHWTGALRVKIQQQNVLSTGPNIIFSLLQKGKEIDTDVKLTARQY